MLNDCNPRIHRLAWPSKFHLAQAWFLLPSFKINREKILVNDGVVDTFLCIVFSGIALLNIILLGLILSGIAFPRLNGLGVIKSNLTFSVKKELVIAKILQAELAMAGGARGRDRATRQG